MEQDIRWKQRLSNLSHAYGLLREALEAKPPESMSVLVTEAGIHRFEYTFELMWKTLADYLAYFGNAPEFISPRTIIKKCAVSGLLDEIGADAETLLAMLETRNNMSHNYDEEKFRQAYADLRDTYLAAIGKIHAYLSRKAAE